ncbi:class I SAM-dependent methyltransferase [Acetivibrio straminisolvens]|jgi:tRNA (cmo5U34)-methyltransferase|uniref:class I SAM-dependent methyltransferase n=1 Tax=Acetivibrio straminisolvens TaxID=253314 RepID=UPI0016B0820A|nr:class I SAM-dependent methyltransferase [Acetivibrio straminisolvens]NLM59289.1 class I SAM-dependent methyltransferase [Clostridium sp.]
METVSSWKNKMVVESFIKGQRAALPNAIDQLNVMLHILRHNEVPTKTFVDLGGGDGILSHLILEQFREARGYVLDFSDPMIEAANKRLEKYLDRVKIIKCDIAFPDWHEKIFTGGMEKVDAFVSGYCIHHLHHGRKYELYQEIYDRLEHNGLFINIEHVASKSAWGEMLSDEAFIDSIFEYEKNLENARSREQISKDFHNREDKKDNILLSVETQCEWLREIGFKQVDVFFKSFELAVFAGKKL